MRLNKEIRSEIVENAFKASNISNARKALTSRSVALTEKIRVESLGRDNLDVLLNSTLKEIQMLLKKRDIPDCYVSNPIFPKSSYVLAQFGEYQTTLHFDGSMRYSESSQVNTLVRGCVKAVTRLFAGGDRLIFNADHPYTQEWRAIRLEAKELIDKEAFLRNSVAATVGGFNTTERLIEAWPECAALIPKSVEKASKPLAIAVRADTLNALIGLPQ